MVLIALLAACGCSGYGAGSSAPVQDNPHDDSPIAAGPLQLPAFPAHRQGSALFPLEQTGKMAVERALTAFDDGDSLKLVSLPVLASWGIWTFDPGLNYLDELQIQISTSQDDEAWLALANYDSGRWELKGPYASEISALKLSLGPQHLSPKGKFSCAVIAADGAEIFVDSLTLTTDDGWRIVDLGMQPYPWLPSVDIALVDGHPAILASSIDLAKLYYVRASDPMGDEAGDWGEPIVLQEDLCYDVNLELINGNPAVAMEELGKLVYMRSSTPGGESLLDWSSPVTIDKNYSGVTATNSLAEVQGRPALAYYSSNAELSYVRSATAEGTAAADWEDPISILSDQEYNGQAPQLQVLAGRPAILFHSESQPKTLNLLPSESITGADASDWDIAGLLTLDNGAYSPDLLPIGNGAAISYVSPGGSLKFNHAADASPAEIGNWDVPVQFANAFSGGAELDMELIGGVPAIAYSVSHGDASWVSLHFALPDTQGNPPYANWIEMEVDPEMDIANRRCRLVDVNGQPGIVYISSSTTPFVSHTVKYAVRVSPWAAKQ